MIWAACAAALVAGIAIGAALVRRRPEENGRAELEEQLRAEKESRSAFMGTVGSGLAHELKTPLSTANVNVQLLDEMWRSADTEKERRARKKIESLQRSLSKIEEILKSFVRFARDPRPQKSAASLHKLIQSVLEEDLAEALEASGRMGKVKVEYKLDENLPKVSIDVSLMRQVIFNILLNAAESIEGEGQVTIRTGRKGARVRLSVSDTGRGISEEHKARIWEMYFTTKPSGIGMGLPISRQIVEAHGGAIEFESNGGTTFHLDLPVSDE